MASWPRSIILPVASVGAFLLSFPSRAIPPEFRQAPSQRRYELYFAAYQSGRERRDTRCASGAAPSEAWVNWSLPSATIWSSTTRSPNPSPGTRTPTPSSKRSPAFVCGLLAQDASANAPLHNLAPRRGFGSGCGQGVRRTMLPALTRHQPNRPQQARNRRRRGSSPEAARGRIAPAGLRGFLHPVEPVPHDCVIEASASCALPSATAATRGSCAARAWCSSRSRRRSAGPSATRRRAHFHFQIVRARLHHVGHLPTIQIGRASCRERV